MSCRDDDDETIIIIRTVRLTRNTKPETKLKKPKHYTGMYAYENEKSYGWGRRRGRISIYTCTQRKTILSGVNGPTTVD